MKITLLIHEKEQNRADNSGKLLKKTSGLDSQSILWRRTHPDSQLVKALANGEAVLLCQQGDGRQRDSLDEVKQVVILDGTWQEARKMYNKSPYLKTADWYTLANPPVSKYNLRRNQVDGGLCTAECAIQVLKLSPHEELSVTLEQHFEQFLNDDRSNQ